MTIHVQTSQPLTTQETWETALRWVVANRKLVHQIGSPYIRHMSADSNDLFQEATIAAFKTLVVVQKKGKASQFVPFFRVIFKTSCIKLASGIQTVDNIDDYHIPSPEQPEDETNLEPSRIEAALQTVSKRQREICLWLLQQPAPVSTPDLARQFKVSRRQACRLISNSIQRISKTGPWR